MRFPARPCATPYFRSSLLAGLVLASPALAEVKLGFHLGVSATQSSDVSIEQGLASQWVFSGVSWMDKSFQPPPYYSARLAYFFESAPRWGISLDYTHAKILADLDRPLQAAGIRDGVPFSSTETIGDTFSRFEMTNGLNFLTASIVYRDFWFQDACNPRGLVQPYVGLGLGAAFPHVETSYAGQEDLNLGFQWKGPAWQAMVGMEYLLTKHWSIVTEYRFQHVDLDVSIRGGRAQTTANTHQFVVGPQLRW